MPIYESLFFEAVKRSGSSNVPQSKTLCRQHLVLFTKHFHSLDKFFKFSTTPCLTVIWLLLLQNKYKYNRVRIVLYLFTLAQMIVLYGYETWSLTLTPRLWASSRVLRTIFGSEGEEVTGELRSFIMCNLYQILSEWSNQEDKIGGTHSTKWNEKCIYNFWWKLEGKRLLWRPWCRGVNNNEMDLGGRGRYGSDTSGLG